MTVAPEKKRSLDPLHYWILAVWMAVVVVLTAAILISSTDSEGWEGLIAIIGFMFFGASVVILGSTALIARFLQTSRRLRTATVVLAPPAVLALLILLLQVG